jgi:hypothetical protein
MIFNRILIKLLRRRRLERDMEAELAFHRDMAREHSNPIGLGNVTRIQEEARDLWRFTIAEDFFRDLMYALRSLRRTPGFAAIAIVTLALGIGANTAIFTLLHRVMLAPLPVHEPERLIEVLGIRGNGPPGVAFSYAALQDLRRGTQTCSNIIGFSNVIVRIPGQVVHLFRSKSSTDSDGKSSSFWAASESVDEMSESRV